MAVLFLDFYSRELKMSTPLTMIVPDSTRIGQTPLSKRKVLYLLHGLSDDATSCLRLSKVELYAQETGLVVVMPSAGRSMYADGLFGQNYFSYIAKELPEYLGLLFHLSTKKEDNFIAGISMGGMGAARIALTYPNHYAKVFLLSGLLDVRMLIPYVTQEHKEEFPFIMNATQDKEIPELNPIHLLNNKVPKTLPIEIYCGKQDDLYLMSVAFYEKANELQLPVTAYFSEGIHDWHFWDDCLKAFIPQLQ